MNPTACVRLTQRMKTLPSHRLGRHIFVLYLFMSLPCLICSVQNLMLLFVFADLVLQFFVVAKPAGAPGLHTRYEGGGPDLTAHIMRNSQITANNQLPPADIAMRIQAWGPPSYMYTWGALAQAPEREKSSRNSKQGRGSLSSKL